MRGEHIGRSMALRGSLDAMCEALRVIDVTPSKQCTGFVQSRNTFEARVAQRLASDVRECESPVCVIYLAHLLVHVCEKRSGSRELRVEPVDEVLHGDRLPVVVIDTHSTGDTRPSADRLSR